MITTKKWQDYLLEAECILSIAAIAATLLWIIAASAHDFVAGKALSIIVIAVAIITVAAMHSYLKH